MNLISRLLDRYIHNDEKELAFKISIASFVILITILIFIITTSYMYQRNGAYREFQNENIAIANREEMPEIIRNAPKNILSTHDNQNHRGPRNMIVFNKQRQVIKNDFLDLNMRDINLLFSLRNTQNTGIEFMGHTYLISRSEINNSTIFIFHDLTPLRQFHITLLIIALIGSLIGLIGIYFLSRYLAHITIAPIREQARELEAYSHNVAHELRTPLSVMRSNLELLKLKPEARFIHSTDEEITGMERIIESLLFLAKPNQGMTKTDINITTKTEEIISKYIPENTIKLSSEKKDIHKHGSAELYTRILCNLIENAIKYKSGGPIDIILSKDSIKISNTIEQNLTGEEQKNLTKVFYQWDLSRNSTGYGLGLALVTKIVEISGWTMDISTHNKRFTVEISF